MSSLLRFSINLFFPVLATEVTFSLFALQSLSLTIFFSASVSLFVSFTVTRVGVDGSKISFNLYKLGTGANTVL